MTLPQLYEHVALHSYPDIKYVNGRPEGFGSGSPFMMALNGLVTKSYAGVVKDFRIWGEWKETGVEDFAKGRVPDNSMMLNMLLRVCVDKMAKLQSFSWELDCKPLKTLYQGLAARNTLTSLTAKFPSSRLPRPSVCVPAMPNLKVLKAIDIDPLCYPDDISYLILGSKNLQDLRLHFAPRMRQKAEPTLSLETYFGRCFKAGYTPKLKHFAMQNWFGPNHPAMGTVMNPESCESMCFLDTFGGVQGGSANVYVDDTWRLELPPGSKFNYQTARFNEFAEQHVSLIKNSTGLKKVYVVNDRAGKPAMSSTSTTPESNADYITPDDSPAAAGSSTAGPSEHDIARAAKIAAFGPSYLSAFTQYHGDTLQHLLLSSQWPLTEQDISSLIRCCPNLTQLGMALGVSQESTLRILLPFLPKLFALRILDHEGMKDRTPCNREIAAHLGRDLYAAKAHKLRFIGDCEALFRAGGPYQHFFEDGRSEMRRLVERVGVEEVKDVEIWRLDCLDIMADVGPVG